jgi:hypothetical protein
VKNLTETLTNALVIQQYRQRVRQSGLPGEEVKGKQAEGRLSLEFCNICKGTATSTLHHGKHIP